MVFKEPFAEARPKMKTTLRSDDIFLDLIYGNGPSPVFAEA